jgi:type I restriction enzyme S subunit
VLLERILKERREKWEAEQLAQMKAKGKTPKDDSWKLKYKEPVAPDTSDLPELPEGWMWASWNQLSDWITYGFTRPMPHVDEGIPIVTAKHVVNGKINTTNTHKTTKEAFLSLSQKDCPNPGDILITKDGTIGRAAVVTEEGQFCINQSVAVVWLRSCQVHRQYLLAVIESPLTQKPIWAKARGVAIQHLSITDFALIPLPLPSLDEQIAIVEKIERYLSISDELEKVVNQNLKRAEKLRQSILKKAFEGKLVPQDPTDEPADKLLEGIKAEKAKREAEAKAKKKQKQPGKPQQLELF